MKELIAKCNHYESNTEAMILEERFAGSLIKDNGQVQKLQELLGKTLKERDELRMELNQAEIILHSKRAVVDDLKVCECPQDAASNLLVRAAGASRGHQNKNVSNNHDEVSAGYPFELSAGVREDF